MAEDAIYRARILVRRERTHYTEDMKPVPVKEILYSTRFLHPSIVTIPLLEYSEEREAEVIREDITRRLTEEPEVRQV